MRDFKPSERFTVKRLLGAGGMGVVYEAFDNERQVRVALKTLSRFDPGRLYLFKQEFRSLADITHPNLVNLYELIADDGQWYFTMEFVEGLNLMQFAWEKVQDTTPVGPQSGAVNSTTVTAPFAMADSGGSDASRISSVEPVARGSRRASFDDIRDAVRQMVEGINFLHRSGKLHRDIKPSNIMLTHDGRLVLLDFGLVGELRQFSTKSRLRVGTVAYMAPEQATGAALAEAADWYAAGCSIFEVLTGRLPFCGSSEEIVQAKLSGDPPDPRSLDDCIPDDLAQLAIDLLNRAPEKRPTPSEIVDRIGRHRTLTNLDLPRPAQTLLIGRERDLDQLRAWFETAEVGEPVLAFVHGPSGFGKTSLIEAFLDELVSGKRALLLRGRCYEQESVPYKGFDSLVDSLVRHMEALPEPELASVMPPHAEALAQLFPVMRRIVPRAEGRWTTVESDPLQLRQKGFNSLRELIKRLALRQPVVLFIDDLHWGDLDSSFLLADILRLAGGFPLLVLCSYRSEYAHTSPCLKALWDVRMPEAVKRRELVVGPLSVEQSERLALSVLPENEIANTARAQTIAREAGGSPFFVLELANYFDDTTSGAPAGASSGSNLDDVIWDRVTKLSPIARKLLELVAISGQPLRRSHALTAACEGVDDPAIMTVLRAGRLLRSAGLSREDEIETYHDRIREAIVSHLTPELRRECHLSLAHVLEDSGNADAERLGVHFHGAGDVKKAGRYYRLGADRASQALAFDRACDLYNKALDLLEAGDSAHHQLTVQLADALANAGRGTEAARQYLAACAQASSDQIFTFRRKAAYQYCASGHVDEGKEVFRHVLAAVGEDYPSSPRSAITSIFWNSLRLRFRGTQFRKRAAGEIPPPTLNRLNALSSATSGVALVDMVAGADFAGRLLHLALEAGEPSHVARGLSWLAWQTSGQGPRAESKAMPLLAKARAAAESSADPLALAWSRLAAGVSYLQFGRWRASVETLEDTLRLLRRDCREVAWEIATASTCQLLALDDLGEYSEMRARAPSLLKDAVDRGDMYAATNIGTWVMPQIKLADDSPADAREYLRTYESRWSQQGFHLQHLWALISEASVDLYEGKAEAATRRLEERWNAARHALVFRIYLPRIFAYHVRACAYLQAAEGAADPQPSLALVRRDEQKLERENTPFTSALALLLRAGIAGVQKNLDSSVALLCQAEQAFLAIDMNAYVASVRYWLAYLFGGDEGRESRARSLQWMTQHGIRNPEKMAARHAPGFRALTVARKSD